jgi:hypothetical protein
MKKLNRLLNAVLAATLGFTATFNLIACEHNPSEGQTSACAHTFGAWTPSQNTVNCNGGDFTRVCAECGHIEKRKGTQDDHSFSYEHDASSHWAVCDVCNETSAPAAHEEDGTGTCKECGFLIPTSCVYYELSEDGSYAIVTGYDEMETDFVVIAATHDGVPVKEIQASAFAGCASLEQVVLPDTITTIGENAFDGCKRLMAVYLSKNVLTVGENAFKGCLELTIFTAYDKQSLPAGWSENFNPESAFIFGNHDGKRADNVSEKSMLVSESVLLKEEQARRQVLVNEDLSSVRIPGGFSKLTRFDAKTQPPGTPWTEGNLYYYNWDQTKLTDYGEVWFALKLKNAFWVYTHARDLEHTPKSWMYVHLKQTGETWDGFTLWTIELSIGGYIVTTIVEQTGRYIDDDRPTNSIARLLWDEGFGSADGNAILIYNFGPYDKLDPTLSIYTTEVRGVRVGA